MTTTLPQMVNTRVARYGERPALRRKQDGRFQPISWRQLGAQIDSFSRALLALGLEPGQQAGILAPNCPEWVYADLAIMTVGGRTVPIYHTEGLGTIRQIIADSECRLLFIHCAQLALELLQWRAELPLLQAIVLLDNQPAPAGVMSLEDFLAAGQQIDPQRVDTLRAAGAADQLATIVYTSGTTGEPKGALLTHANILSNVEACSQLIALGPDDESLSFLPLSHIFERMAGYYLMLHQGVTINYAESIEAVPLNLTEVRPTIVTSVPRLYEKMHARVLERVNAGPWLKKQLFHFAIRLGKEQVARDQTGRATAFWQKALLNIFDRLVFAKIKARLGGRLRFFVSGGAPLVKEIAEFFLAAGVPIYEGYGLTETSPVIAVNTPSRHRLGSVGPPLPNLELQIAEDGELLVRGPSVFQGYWKKPEQTAAALSDGWFRTGDIAEIDSDGFLRITDRKKDLIVNAGGKKIAPLELESLLKTDKFISSLMVYGDRRPYLVALVIPDFESLQQYASYKKLNFLDPCDLINHPQVLSLLRRRIDRLQQHLPSYRQIKRFALLSRDFSGERGEVTPTMKLKRTVIGQTYAGLLDDLYREQGEGIYDRSVCLVDKH